MTPSPEYLAGWRAAIEAAAMECADIISYGRSHDQSFLVLGAKLVWEQIRALTPDTADQGESK